MSTTTRAPASSHNGLRLATRLAHGANAVWLLAALLYLIRVGGFSYMDPALIRAWLYSWAVVVVVQIVLDVLTRRR